MPLPIEALFRVQDSPVPTHTTLRSLGSSATAPMDCTGWRSKTGLKVVPESVDFHTPPDAEPTNIVTLPSFSGRAAMAAIRPLIRAEPMLRAPSPETREGLERGSLGAAARRAIDRRGAIIGRPSSPARGRQTRRR